MFMGEAHDTIMGCCELQAARGIQNVLCLFFFVVVVVVDCCKLVVEKKRLEVQSIKYRIFIIFITILGLNFITNCKNQVTPK